MNSTSRTAAAVLALALLSLPVLGGDSNRLNFDLLDKHLVVVHGAIGPLKDLRLLIDTGANPTMIDRRLAKKLALRVEAADFIAFGQKKRVATAVLPDVRIGSFRVEAVTAGVGDLSFLHGVDAVVGLDVLSRSSFSLDYRAREIAFGAVDPGGLSTSLEATGPFLTVQLGASGRLFRLLIDTGSNRLVLFRRRAEGRLPTLAVHGEQTFNHLSGTATLQRVILPSVDTGGWTSGRVEAFLSDAPVDGYPPGIDGVLGVRVLAANYASFDLERGRFGFR